MDYWNIIWFIVLFYAVVISIILLKNGKNGKKDGEDFAKLAAFSAVVPVL